MIDMVSPLPPIGKCRWLAYNYGSCHWSAWEITQGSDMSVTTVTIWQLVNEENEIGSLKEWEIIFQRIRHFPNDPGAQCSLCLFAKLSGSLLSLARRIIILCEPAVSKMPAKNYKKYKIIKIMFIASTVDVRLGSPLKGKVECSHYWLVLSIDVNVRQKEIKLHILWRWRSISTGCTLGSRWAESYHIRAEK